MKAALGAKISSKELEACSGGLILIGGS